MDEERAHARISPSDAETWLNCPGSIGLREQLDIEEESEYALEGTAFHGYAERLARHELLPEPGDDWDEVLKSWRLEFPGFWDEAEMHMHAVAYVDYLRETMDQMEQESGAPVALFLEIRVYPGIPECWGTSDAILVSQTEIRAVDAKYGAGVAVEAKGNPQLRIYGIGAYLMFGEVLGTVTHISSTVFQPRIGGGHVLTETLPVEEVMAWRDQVAIPAAEKAIAGSDEFGPSEKACRWCSAAGRCRAQLADIFRDEDLFDAPPADLTGEEMAEALSRVPFIRSWLQALEESALTLLYQKDANAIPGWKCVMSGGRRYVIDPAKAAAVLEEAGYGQETTHTTKIKGIGELEKLLGKDFKNLLEEPGIVGKSDGRPSLTTEDDERPSTNPHKDAARVFGAQEEN